MEERHQLEQIEILTQKSQLPEHEENQRALELNIKVFSLEGETSRLKEKSKAEILEMEGGNKKLFRKMIMTQIMRITRYNLIITMII